MAEEESRKRQGGQSQGEAVRTRGIDSHAPEPVKGSRQEMAAPTEQFDRTTGNFPDDPQNPTADAHPSQKKPPADNSAGSGNPVKYANKPITTGGQLEGDEGVAEQEKDPIE